ncbi:MAG: hypothetical protein K9N46_05780 [Candidatus Marinimicrobia bacterium]|nr:hypothetical protein [Candidatus Neomarinimicrobiota bacterium]MCF7880231.1 hypothetical protein [Candidatus Neomarinimicrobiota bacterium]
MRWNKLVILGAALIVVGTLGRPEITAGQHLWNITSDGDTLRYVNIFGQQPDSLNRFPQYLTEQEYLALLRRPVFSRDSIAFAPDVREFLKAAQVTYHNPQQLAPQYENIWQPVLALTLTGTASAYFKLQANSAYARYQESIDRATIRKYYNRTRKYDSYSAISFVLLQASFGWLSYKLLW